MVVSMHTEFSECVYHAHALARRVVLVRQLFAEDARWTAEKNLGSTNAATDLISWGQPHGHMAFINIGYGVPCVRAWEYNTLLPVLSRSCGS